MAGWQEAVDKQAEIQQLTEELDPHVSLVDVPRQLMRLAANEALQQVPAPPPLLYAQLLMVIFQEAFVADRCVKTFKVEEMPDGIRWDAGPAAGAGGARGLELGSGTLQHQQLCSEAESSSLLQALQDPLLQQPDPCCVLTCAALLKLAHLSHLERRAKILWCSGTAGPSSCFQKGQRLPAGRVETSSSGPGERRQ